MRLMRLLCCGWLILGPAQATAAGEVLEERFSLALGGFRNSLSLQGRVDDAVIEGTQIDFEDQFDFDNRRRLDFAELRMRAFGRHEFGIKAFRDARIRRAVLDETLRFDGEEFLVDAEAEARIALRSLEFDYTWWVWARPHQALGIQLGVLRFSASLSIRGRVRVDGEGEAEGQAAVSDRFFVPLAGLAWRRQLGPHWRLESELRYLRRSYRGIDGRAVSGHLGVEWLTSRHLSLMLQYGYTEVELAQDKPDLSGALQVGFQGPQALLRLRW